MFKTEERTCELWSFGTAVYEFHLLGASGEIVAVQRISALSDEEGLSIARAMVKDASAVARFELWDGERCIHGTPTIREKPRR